jgi:hypothetical protein
MLELKKLSGNTRMVTTGILRSGQYDLTYMRNMTSSIIKLDRPWKSGYEWCMRELQALNFKEVYTAELQDVLAGPRFDFSIGLPAAFDHDSLVQLGY